MFKTSSTGKAKQMEQNEFQFPILTFWELSKCC